MSIPNLKLDYHHGSIAMTEYLEIGRKISNTDVMVVTP
jgi:hypothetical protein